MGWGVLIVRRNISLQFAWKDLPKEVHPAHIETMEEGARLDGRIHQTALGIIALFIIGYLLIFFRNNPTILPNFWLFLTTLFRKYFFFFTHGEILMFPDDHHLSFFTYPMSA